MEVTLHPEPRFRDVVLQQIRIVGLNLRIVALVIAIVLGFGTLVIVSEILGGGPGFDAREMFPTPLITFLLPFAVWRGENRFGPALLWTFPVDRRRLALARVFAGLVWTMAALAFFVTWLFVLALLAHAPVLHVVTRVPVTASIGTYLLGSAVVLGLRHPLRWLFGAAGVLFLMGNLSEALERKHGVQTLLGSSALYFAAEDAGAFWDTLPGLARWSIATSLLLGAGLIALWAATSRHKENR